LLAFCRLARLDNNFNLVVLGFLFLLMVFIDHHHQRNYK
jgi:hypothetical protein